LDASLKATQINRLYMQEKLKLVGIKDELENLWTRPKGVETQMNLWPL